MIQAELTLKPRQKGTQRRQADSAAGRLFGAIAGASILLLAGVMAVLVYKAWPLLQSQSLGAVLAGVVWKPSSGTFGLLPFILGTTWTTGLGSLLAVPLSLLAAIYLSEFARPLTRNLLKPVLDILAGIPSVVYGMWGVITLVPFIQNQLAPWLQAALPNWGLFQSENPTGYGILTASVVLALMVSPIMISIMYEVIHNVPAGLRKSSLAVGADRWQTIKRVVLPKAANGILAAIVLGISRALGETMAVMMVVGNVATIPHSIFDAAYPIPALIANNYGEMMSIPLYNSALMSAALLLLAIVLVFNIVASLTLRRTLR